INDPAGVHRIVICTGKIYYDLEKMRGENKMDGEVPLVRIEQLYPFPREKVAAVLARYPQAKEICWTQEEPVNMGAWTFMRQRLEIVGKGRKLRYVGRRGSGSTAEGSLKSHQVEQQRIVQDALGLACSLERKA